MAFREEATQISGVGSAGRKEGVQRPCGGGVLSMFQESKMAAGAEWVRRNGGKVRSA